MERTKRWHKQLSNNIFSCLNYLLCPYKLLISNESIIYLWSYLVHRVLLFIFKNVAKEMAFCRPACLSSLLFPTWGCLSFWPGGESRAEVYSHPASMATTVGFTAYTVVFHRQDQPSSHCHISHCSGFLMICFPEANGFVACHSLFS